METVAKRFYELTLDELYEILALRASVFVVEQQWTCLDVDGRDKEAYHVFLRDEEGIAAYLRVLGDNEYGDALIGRVIAKRRGIGLGAAVVAEGIKTARERMGASSVIVESQSYAVGFYEKQGFSVISDEFLEEGTPHIRMKYE
ncbi:MAG: GNAT family N-acetyltransferase [Clostridia bacterium]|nr:GNAT family N-acetyltransferase [Clostridia bacterium]